ncbi:hypothetical protein [Niveispirillum cyanobacteriorum]
MAMPILPEEIFLEAVETLVRADVDWIPGADGASLYLRPSCSPMKASWA